MNRNTQFQGFAKALVDELTKPEMVAIGMRISSFRGEWERIIARRAYDLASHCIDNTSSRDLECMDLDDVLTFIPDMPELPKEQE